MMERYTHIRFYGFGHHLNRLTPHIIAKTRNEGNPP